MAELSAVVEQNPPQEHFSWGVELYRTVSLAVPVILVQVGNLLMGIVDTVIVGKVNSHELAGVAAGNSLFGAALMASVGLQMGLDTIISQAIGARDIKTCDRCLGQGVLLSLVASALVTPLLYLASGYYGLTGATPEVVEATKPYLAAVCWSFPLVMLFNVLLKYWQACGIVFPASIIMLVANVINYYAASAFVAGHWGFPRLGAAGVGYATFASRLFTLVALSAVSYFLWRKRNAMIARGERPKAIFSAKCVTLLAPFQFSSLWTYDAVMMRKVLALGLPALGQVSLEVGAFSLATTFVSQLGVVPLATHQIVLTIASFTFTFPLGLSSACAVRVGILTGAHRMADAVRAGWLGIALGGGIMACFALCLYLFAPQLIGFFTNDENVVATSGSIMAWAILFQVFDGIQVAGAGALRGFGDTKLSFFANLTGHYAVGLVLGLTFCFYKGWGLPGIWLGLAAGLMSTALFIVIAWMKASRYAIAR